MVMYKKVRRAVSSKHGISEKFEIKTGVHQGSILSPFLFVAVIEALKHDI